MASAKQKAWRKTFVARYGGGRKKRSRSGGHVAKKKRSGSSGFRVPSLGGVKPIVDKAAKGLGYSMLVGAGLALVGQPGLASNPIVKFGSAFAGGGLEGVGAQLLLGGGMTSGGSSNIPLNG